MTDIEISKGLIAQDNALEALAAACDGTGVTLDKAFATIVNGGKSPAQAVLKANGCEAVVKVLDELDYQIYNVPAFCIARRGIRNAKEIVKRFLAASETQAKLERQRKAQDACENGAKEFIKFNVAQVEGYIVTPWIDCPIDRDPTWNGLVSVGIARNPHYASTSVSLPGMDKVHYHRAHRVLTAIKSATL